MIEFLFLSEAKWLWTVTMMVTLFFSVRKIIWVMTVRRAIKKVGEAYVDDVEKVRLMKRSSFTAGLLSILFSFFYAGHIFTS